MRHSWHTHCCAQVGGCCARGAARGQEARGGRRAHQRYPRTLRREGAVARARRGDDLGARGVRGARRGRRQLPAVQAAPQARARGGAGGSSPPRRVRAPEQAPRRAPKLHHLHAQRLAHRRVALVLQQRQRAARRVRPREQSAAHCPGEHTGRDCLVLVDSTGMSLPKRV